MQDKEILSITIKQIKRAISGDIFFEEELPEEQQLITENTWGISTKVDYLQQESLTTNQWVPNLTKEFKRHISERSDIPFHDGTTISTPDDLIRSIYEIYELEISLFDEKKSHYEIQSIKNALKEQKTKVELYTQWEEYIGLKDDLNIFSTYINFISLKSSISFESEIDQEVKENIIKNDIRPYSSLIYLDQVLDPKSDDSKKKKFKGLVTEYYKEYKLWFNLIENHNPPDSEIDKILFVDLYLYFWYVKNHKFSEEEHFKAYLELNDIFQKFFITKSKTFKMEDQIWERIYKTNRIFFLNYLISTLASAFIKDLNRKEKQVSEIETYKTSIESLVKDYQDEHSYFTYYKLSRLYLGIWKYYLDKWDVEKAKSHLLDSKESLKEARKRYNLPWGALLRFYPDKEIISESKVFSLSWFCRTHGSDFSTRVFALEFDIIEFWNDIVQKTTEMQNNNLQLTVDAKNIEQQSTLAKALADSKKLLEDSGKHNIEILWIFAAIVLFVSWNIQIFQYISSIKLAIVFMVWFAWVLTVFVLLLRGDLKLKDIPEEKKSEDQKNASSCEIFFARVLANPILVLLFILIVVCWIYLFNADESELKNEKYIDNIKSEIKKDQEYIKNLSGDNSDINISNINSEKTENSTWNTLLKR